MAEPVSAVLWDLDGTLADTAGDIALAVNQVIVALGLAPLPESRVRDFIGAGAGSLVEGCVAAAGGVPEREHVARFLSAYRAHPCVASCLFPGVAHVVASVTLPQAICTNKPADLSEAVLRALQLRHPFQALIAGDTLPVRKPDPAPLRAAMAALGVSSAVMVGDGPHDVEGAHNAGLPVIGVTWGIGHPHGADRVVHSAEELQEALAEFGACRYR